MPNSQTKLKKVEEVVAEYESDPEGYRVAVLSTDAETMLTQSRQDIERVLVERLSGMKQIIGGQLEISADESLVEMFGNVIELKEEMSYNQALDQAITLVKEVLQGK